MVVGIVLSHNGVQVAHIPVLVPQVAASRHHAQSLLIGGFIQDAGILLGQVVAMGSVEEGVGGVQVETIG